MTALLSVWFTSLLPGLRSRPAARRRPRSALALCFLVVPTIVVGLLAMHGVRSLHAKAHEMVHAADSVVDGERSVVRSTSALEGHGGHDAASCIWILVTGIALVIAAVRRHRIRTAPIADPLRLLSAIATRGPPISTRLSLVGLLRR